MRAVCVLIRYIFLVLLLSIAGCKLDSGSTDITPSIKATDLQGTWHMYYVSRNGKETKTLENGYFSFQDDKRVKSNLFPQEINYTFEFEQDKIEIEGLKMFNTFTIEALQNDTLILDSKVREFDMKFFLTKSK